MTITVTIEFMAAEGKRDALIDTMNNIIPDTLAFEGCQRIEMFELGDSPGSLMLLEDWESAEHYAAYKAWRRESGTSVLAGDLVAGEPTTRSFNNVRR